MTAGTEGAPVGRSGLTVSKVGFGAAPLGGRSATAEADAQAVETVRYALTHGCRLIDTAPLYGAGRSERLLGQALAGVDRRDYVLATKVGRIVMSDGTVVFDFTRDGVLRSLDQSLRRLRIDRIDILHIHDADAHYREALDVVFPVLADLRGQGVIGAIGAGMNQWQMELELARSADFDCFLLAGRYTLLEQTAVHTFLPYCLARGIAVFLGGVYNSGILAVGAQPGATYNYKAAPSAVVERVRRIEAVCSRHGVPLHVAATQFPLAHAAITSIVLGMQSRTEVRAALDALATPVPPELWAELRVEELLDEATPTPS